MTPLTTLRRALTDPGLLGSALAGPSWLAWRALLLAARGEALETDELEIFRRLTGRQDAPTGPADEVCIVAGRRGGKSRAMAALAVYVAGLCSHRARLAPGERGVVLLIAPDMRQARVALDYAAGMLDSAPILRQLVADRSAETLSLTTGVDLVVRAASFRRLRGLTAVAILADEACFWPSDESANPDTEILNAARPMLATTGGPLVIVSSPYARRGEVYDIWRRHHGPDGDPGILVAHGESRDFNPSLPLRVVERALERDPAAARAEYLGLWRDDVETFVSRDAVTACVETGRHERAPEAGREYVAFVDPSGGVADSMTLAIAHAEDVVAVLDAVREVRPPFSPEAVVEDFVSLLRRFGLTQVTGDRYGGEWPREAFRRRGVTYEPSARTKSDIYRDLLPALNSGDLRLLDDDRLVAQIAGLERRTARGGRDSIDHAPGGHDDLANAAAGALMLAGDAAHRFVGGAVAYLGLGTGGVLAPTPGRRLWHRGPGISAETGQPVHYGRRSIVEDRNQ